MRKLTILFAALTLSVGLWANEITYKATTALTFEDGAFDLGIATHAWNANTRNGNISFNGDVTEIKEGAFKNCSTMTSITLPNTITKIGDQAFVSCSGLTSFTIPNSVITIGSNAFSMCLKLESITIPNSVTSVENGAFSNCESLTSVTFMGTTCQNAIGTDAFRNVGTQTTTTLTLPEDWNYDAAPESSSTAWYGGIFNSNFYSTIGTQDKQAAIDAVTAILGEYTTRTHLQSLLAEEVAKINNAANRPEVNERKQAASDRLAFAVSSFDAGYTDGKTDGDAIGYQRAKDELPTDPEGNKGTAIVVTKGEKSVMLINPERVEYIKVTE